MLMEPPRFLCAETRSWVIVLSAIGATVSILRLISNQSTSRFANIFTIIFQLITLFGAIKNNRSALKFSLWVSLLSIIFAAVILLIAPVLVSSGLASGISNVTESFGELEVTPDEKNRFYSGLAGGYAVEFVTAYSLGVEIGKYILINRTYMYASSMVLGGNVGINNA